MPIEPDMDQLQEIRSVAGAPEDGPLVMLNLNRYKDRDAYLRYGEVAARVLDKLGGRILWHAPAHQTVIGDDSDLYDEVIAVWYPSAESFISLVSDPEIAAARADRVAGLERAALIRCEAADEPVLPTP